MLRITAFTLGCILLILTGWQFVLRQNPSPFSYLAYARRLDGGIYRSWMDGSHGVKLWQTPPAFFNDFAPRWSPDGEWLALRLRQNVSLEGYVLRSDGSFVTPLTPDQDTVERVHGWSPDSQWLLFSTNVSGQFDLYRFRPTDQRVEQLTNTPENEDYAVWSPDGQWVAFVSTQDGTPELFLMRPDGSEIQALTKTDRFAQKFNLAWSPDSQWLSYSANFQLQVNLYRIHIEERQPQLLKHSEDYTYAYRVAAIWLPDSSAFLVAWNSDVLMMAADGSWEKRIIDDISDFPISLDVSPDGKWLVFEAFNGLTYTSRVDDSQRKVIIPTPDDHFMKFSPPVSLPMNEKPLLIASILLMLVFMMRLPKNFLAYFTVKE